MKWSSALKGLTIGCLTVFLASCKNLPNKPELTFCGLFSEDTAECAKGAEEPFDLPTSEMLGYQCVSPDDFAAAKKYLNELDEYVETECKDSK